MNTNTISDVTPWHALSQAEIVHRVATNSVRGLDLPDVSARLQKYGLNCLPEGTKRGALARWPWLLAVGLTFFFFVEVEKLVIRSSAWLRTGVTAVEAGAK